MRIDALISYFVLLLSFQDRASRSRVRVESTKLGHLGSHSVKKKWNDHQIVKSVTGGVIV